MNRCNPTVAAQVVTAAVLVAWSLLTAGDSAAEGQYSHFALSCVLIGFVVLVGVVGLGIRLAVPTPGVLVLPIAVSFIAVVHHPADRYIAMSSYDIHAVQLLVALAVLVAGATLWTRHGVGHLALATIVAVVVAAGLITVIRESHPGIDVWVLLQQSSSGLLHGDDMYRQHWVGSNGLQDVYPYLPITTIVLAPFKWLLGDVRYGLIAASVLAIWFIRRSAPSAPPALAALLVIAPHWIFLTDQSWTEPLLLAALAGAFLALKRDRPWVAVLALAIALACKQHIALLLPLFAVWPSFGWRRTAAAIALAAATVSPWFIAGPRDMWHDAVRANLSLQVQERALNLPSLLARHGVTVGFWFLAVAVLAAYALAYCRLPRTTSGLALGAALVMWTVDLANKDTFFNHYWLPLGLLVIAIAAADPAQATPSSRAPSERGSTGASRPVPEPA